MMPELINSILLMLRSKSFILLSKIPFGVAGTGGENVSIPSNDIAAFILEKQAEFHKALIIALSAISEDKSAFFYFIFLAFSYGVIHAIGPGHGKAIIASYLVANTRAAKVGISLSFGAAFVQAIIALLIVGLVAGLWSGTAKNIEQTSLIIEQLGFLLLFSFSIWIFFRKLRTLLTKDEDSCCCSHDSCEHSLEQIQLLQNNNKTISAREFVIMSVSAGIRPCTGAIILLVFSLTRGLFLFGALSVVAMAFGTAIGTSLFAFLTVKMKLFSMKIADKYSRFRKFSVWIEIFAALILSYLSFTLLINVGNSAI